MKKLRRFIFWQKDLAGNYRQSFDFRWTCKVQYRRRFNLPGLEELSNLPSDDDEENLRRWFSEDH